MGFRGVVAVIGLLGELPRLACPPGYSRGLVCRATERFECLPGGCCRCVPLDAGPDGGRFRPPYERGPRVPPPGGIGGSPSPGGGGIPPQCPPWTTMEPVYCGPDDIVECPATLPDGTRCCRCVSTKEPYWQPGMDRPVYPAAGSAAGTSSTPAPSGQAGPGATPSADPFTRIADMIAGMGAGGLVLGSGGQQAAVPAVVPVQQQVAERNWVAVLLAVSGLAAVGYWYYRRYSRASA